MDANDLVYLRARYYHPGLGVFTSLDPVEGVNRYQYVGGNVANMVDPSGKQTNRCWITGPPCSTYADICDSWSDAWYSPYNRDFCRTIENDPGLTDSDNRTNALFLLAAMGEFGPLLGYGGDSYYDSITHYITGYGAAKFYNPGWYNSYSFVQTHKNELYQWYFDNHYSSTSQDCSTPFSTEVCAKIFVGIGTNNQQQVSDLRFTFAQHYLQACFKTNEFGNIEARFKVEDCFDFECGKCIPLDGFLGIGCVPQEWWIWLEDAYPSVSRFPMYVPMWREEIFVTSQSRMSFEPRFRPSPEIGQPYPYNSGNQTCTVANPTGQLCPIIFPVTPRDFGIHSNSCKP